MQKRAIISVLSAVMAMIILSLTLVFTLGPRVSALHQEALVVTLGAKDFKIVDNVLYGLKDGTAAYLRSLYNYSYQDYNKRGGLNTKRWDDEEVPTIDGGETFFDGSNYSSIELNVQIPDGVIEIGPNDYYSFLET